MTPQTCPHLDHHTEKTIPYCQNNNYFSLSDIGSKQWRRDSWLMWCPQGTWIIAPQDHLTHFHRSQVPSPHLGWRRTLLCTWTCLTSSCFSRSSRKPSCCSSHVRRYLACWWNRNRLRLRMLRTYRKVRIYVGKMSGYCYSLGGNSMIFAVGWEFPMDGICCFLPVLLLQLQESW